MRALGASRTSVATGGVLAGNWARDPLWKNARAVPSLDLNFAGTKTLDSRVTFTRASSGTYVGSDGLIKTATTNEARFDHNPTTGESLGLMVEDARTNICLQSQAITISSPWASQGTAPTIVANAFAAPDGTTTATRVTFAAADSRVTQGSISVINGTTYTVSIYARPVTPGALNVFRLATFDGTNQWNSNDITLAAGWQRVSFTFISGFTGAASLQFRNLLAANVANDVYLWGAQLEAGAFPTSYIPTTSATVTRAADVASITGTNFSSWYNQTEGTVFSDSNIIASQVQTQTVWQLGGGTILTSLRQPQGTSNQFRALIGGTFTASPGTGGLLSAGTSKAGVAYLGTAGRLQVASSGVDSTGSSLDANKLDIGSLNPGSSLNGTIKRLTYWPVRLANTTIQSITAP